MSLVRGSDNQGLAVFSSGERAGPRSILDPFGALTRMIWAILAGCLFAQAYLSSGLWAWPGSLAFALAIHPGNGSGTDRRNIVLACTLVHTWIGLHCWGFLHYGLLLYLATVGYNGLAGLLLGVLLAPARRPLRFQAFRAGLAWTGVEYLRQLGPYGFPLALGATQVHLPLRPAMAVLGAVGLSGLIIAVGVALIRLLLALVIARKSGHPNPRPTDQQAGVGLVTDNRPCDPAADPVERRAGRQAAANGHGFDGKSGPAGQAVATVGWVLALAMSALAGTWQPGLAPLGDPLSVAVVQGGVPTWLHQASQESRVAGLLIEGRYFDLSARALQSGTDLVVMPEAALHRRIPIEGERAAEPLFGLPASELGQSPPLVVTGAYREVWTGPQGEQLALFNSVLLLPGSDPRQILDEVDKQLIVPLAEAEFSRGEGDSLLSIGTIDLGVLICWESMYPRLARDQARQASVLAVSTNDAGFSFAPVTLTHARAGWSRAVETGRPLIRAAQAGISLIVDHRGVVLARLDLFRSGILSAAIQPMEGWTWFTLLGYFLGPLAIGLSVAWALLGTIQRRLSRNRTSNTTA